MRRLRAKEMMTRALQPAPSSTPTQEGAPCPQWSVSPSWPPAWANSKTCIGPPYFGLSPRADVERGGIPRLDEVAVGIPSHRPVRTQVLLVT